MNQRVLDQAVAQELAAVQDLIACQSPSTRAPSHARVREGLRNDPTRPSLYRLVLDGLARGTRHTSAHIACFEVFEQALAVFRCAALALRETMDLLTLDQRQSVERTSGDTKDDSNGRSREKELVNKASFFSNRYALYFAGHVGLAMLGEEPDRLERLFSFGDRHEESRDRDALTQILAKTTTDCLQRILADPQSESLGDSRLRLILVTVFSAWCRQLNWRTWQPIAEATGTAGLTLRVGDYGVCGGAFKRRVETVDVDDRLMSVTRKDVIGCEGFATTLWRNLQMLACYDVERGENPFDPAFVIFTYGAPGGGKTFVSHAHIRSFVELCKQRHQPVWALTHSTTDYASHYQNKTQNELAALAKRINDFPGPVVLYIADADNIFQSRKDPRLSAEQYQTLAVYLKMFDGTLIRKNGKCLAIMDANHVEGIDDATKSRVFDEIVELSRFERAADFAELLRRGLIPLALSGDDWQALGEYLLTSPLSNREIRHVVKQLRRCFEIPDHVFELSFDEQRVFRNQQLQTLTVSAIRERFDGYIATRMAVERESRIARVRADHERFLHFLTRCTDG